MFRRTLWLGLQLAALGAGVWLLVLVLGAFSPVPAGLLYEWRFLLTMTVASLLYASLRKRVG
jgi:hypothetical protein